MGVVVMKSIAFSLLWIAAATAALAGDGVPSGVWYRFDDADDLGRSAGTVPWPAHAFRARAGEGKAGGGLVMDGQGANGLMLPNPAAFFGDSAKAGTIALWVKPDFDPAAGTRDRCIIDFMKEARNTLIDGYEIAIVARGDKLCAQPALGRRMTVPTPLARGRWTHVTLTWDATVGTVLYIDGKQVAERKGRFTPTPLTTWPGRLGAHTPWGAFPFEGTVDELRLFRQMLGAAQIEVLAAPTSPGVSLEVAGWDGKAVKATNRDERPVTVWLREWLAEPYGHPSPWGCLPLPEHEVGSGPVHVGGASGEVELEPHRVRIAPGETVSLPVPSRPRYIGWLRLSVMVDDERGCFEAAGRDYRGLVCEVEPRVLLAGEIPRVRVRFRNDTRGHYAASLIGSLSRPGGGDLSTLPVRPLRVRQGRSTSFETALADHPLPVGTYSLMLTTFTKAGRDLPIRHVPIHVTEPVDYRTIVGVGAAYVQHPPSDDLLRRMAADGVQVLRRHQGRWWNEAATIHPHGFKMWHMAAYSARAICAERLEEAERLGESLGALHRTKPAVLNQTMLGEGLSRPPCYCDACNAAFRRHLRGKHGRISRLNRRWGSDYASYDDVQQLGSPADVDHAADRMQLMERKLPTHVKRRWRELFRLDRPRAIEWKRWHDGVLVEWYRRFARAYHKANRGHTALSEQPCWPTFRHHVLFALGDVADLGGMDLYLPGELPTTLGYASELMCNFDLNASVFAGKPLWLHELYVQDNSPPGLAEAQGWWLVGRGYTMLTYFTYDYYKEGVRAKLPLIFGMFDKGGKPYPCYESFKRFSTQLAQFHRDYDVRTLRREEPRVALFMGDDVSLANWLETGGETWNAAGVHGHVGAYWLTERCGHPVELINDDRFDRLRGKAALVVPWTHVVRQSSLEAILRFARKGGTVIFDGAVGLFDEGYRPCSPLPGGRAMSKLGIAFEEYKDEANELLVADSRIAARGVPVGVAVTDGEILARDAKGNPALIRRPWGRGQVYLLLTSLGRTQRSRVPDPNAVALWRRLLGSAGIRSRHALTVQRAGKAGKLGDPLCDVAVRLKGRHELFVFVVNFFAATRGQVTLRLPEGSYIVADAVSHQPVQFTRADDGYRFPVELPPFGAKIVHVRCTSGRIPWGD